MLNVRAVGGRVRPRGELLKIGPDGTVSLSRGAARRGFIILLRSSHPVVRITSNVRITFSVRIVPTRRVVRWVERGEAHPTPAAIGTGNVPCLTPDDCRTWAAAGDVADDLVLGLLGLSVQRNVFAL